MDILDRPPLDRYDFSRMENMWLKLILEVIAEMIERREMCECQDCVLDTAALALNKLPPRYWILGTYDAFSPPEKFYDDLMNIRMAEEAVMQAYQLVQSNPHH
jgi:competence protein ComFB